MGAYSTRPEAALLAYCIRRDLPRKMKKRVLGTRRQRRRFELAFQRAMSRKLRVHVSVSLMDLEGLNDGRI